MPGENDFRVEKNSPREKGAMKIGKGGDSLHRKIKATNEELNELLGEMSTLQDWVQKEKSNKVALDCLEGEGLKEAYYDIKDGFGEYGPIILMGFKAPNGTEIPRLKIMDKNGEVIDVLSGDMAINEIKERVTAYENFNANITQTTEVIDVTDNDPVISDYNGKIDDYNA